MRLIPGTRRRRICGEAKARCGRGADTSPFDLSFWFWSPLTCCIGLAMQEDTAATESRAQHMSGLLGLNTVPLNMLGRVRSVWLKTRSCPCSTERRKETSAAKRNVEATLEDLYALGRSCESGMHELRGVSFLQAFRKLCLLDPILAQVV